MCKKIILSVALLFSQINICAACSFNQVPSISFGCPPNSASGCLNTSTLQIRCKENSSIQVMLSTGQATSFSPRIMRDNTQGITMQYNVYLDANQSQIFGDGAQGTFIITANQAKNQSVSYTLYSYVLSNTVLAGTYSDSLTLTMSY